LLKYAEEKPDFEVPARYRRDEHTKELLERRQRKIDARKAGKEEYQKVKKEREEKPVRIAPVHHHSGGEQGYINAAEKKAERDALASERPVRIGLGDVEANGRRLSTSSSATRVPTSDDEEIDRLGLDEDEDPNIVTWYGPSEFLSAHQVVCPS
jgi:hypothetical protein